MVEPTALGTQQSIHLSLWLEGGSLGAGLESVVLVEGVGPRVWQEL